MFLLSKFFLNLITLFCITFLFNGCGANSKVFKYENFYFGEIRTIYILSTYSSKYKINIEGKINSEIKIRLPYTNMNEDEIIIPRYEKEIEIDSNLLKECKSNLKLVFSYEKQKLGKGKGVIVGTIKLKDQSNKDVNLIQLDPDYLSELLIAQIELPVDATKKKKIINVKIIGAVKGESFNNTYVYIPIVSPITNKIWLNNNLGADYNLFRGDNYNPLQQAISPLDYKAYGSKFQWGRKADGHELIHYYSSFYGESLYKTINLIANEPNMNYFMINDKIEYDWRWHKDDNLWLKNNVCPNGYKVPTEEDFLNEFVDDRINEEFLRLTYNGLRHYNSGELNLVGKFGFYWTNSVSGIGARYLNISKDSNKFYISSRKNGFSIRCIKLSIN